MGGADRLTLCSKHLIHAHDIGQSKQHRQLAIVFLQATVARFYKTKLTLDNPKRMLNFCRDTRFQVFGMYSDLVDPRMLLQCSEFPELLSDVPVNLMVLQFISFLSATVSRIREDECLFTMKKLVSLIEVVFIRRSCCETVRDAGAGINPDVSLHPEVPLIPFFGLMHLRIALTYFVLG